MGCGVARKDVVCPLAGEFTKKRAIAKHIQLLHKQYREVHRASVSEELAENEVMCLVACKCYSGWPCSRWGDSCTGQGAEDGC